MHSKCEALSSIPSTTTKKKKKKSQMCKLKCRKPWLRSRGEETAAPIKATLIACAELIASGNKAVLGVCDILHQLLPNPFIFVLSQHQVGSGSW
jgi:hypothetical protein